MAEVRDLPGWPKLTLVKKVKSVLFRHLRARPNVNDKMWRLAWQWAEACHKREALGGWTRKRKTWPDPEQIASQYLWLVMLDMRSCCLLRFPWHAAETMPDEVRKLLDFTSTLSYEVFPGGAPVPSTLAAAPPPQRQLSLTALASEAEGPLLTLLEGGRNKVEG